MNNLAQGWSLEKKTRYRKATSLQTEKPLQCLKRSMVGRVELGLEASSFSTRCFVLRCLALTREHWTSIKKRLELTITTSSCFHSCARSLSQFSIPSLAVALVHVLAFFPNRKCSMSSAFSCCSDATLPPTPSSEYQQWRRVTEHGWPA